MEPNIIIPMDYDDKTLKILKESGKNRNRKKNSPLRKRFGRGKTGEVIVLVQQSNA